MIFLMEYDRAQGLIVRLRQFANHDRKKATDERLALEIELNRDGVDREVVLLEAPDEDALRRTHRRYFENLSGVAQSGPVGFPIRNQK